MDLEDDAVPAPAGAADEADDGQYEAPVDPWPPATFDMPLRQPLELKDGHTLRSLPLREPTDGEWGEIGAEKEHLQRRRAISVICGITMADAAKIGIGDATRAEAYLISFFAIGRAIGVA